MPEQTGNTSQGGGAQGATTTTPTVTQTTIGGSGFEARREGIQGIADRLLSRYGTYERALEVLSGENFDYRESVRQRDEKIATLTTNQIPADAVVLTGDERKTWEKFKTLQLPIDKVEAKLKRADELETTVGNDQRLKLVGEVAGAAKFNRDVLAPLLETNQLDVEVRSVTVRDNAGKETAEPTAYVRKRGDQNATWEKLSEFAERDGSPLKPFLPALKAGVTTTGSNNGS